MIFLQVQHGDASSTGANYIPGAATMVTLAFGGSTLAAVRVPALGDEPHQAHAL